MDYLKGRDADVLWLMFRAATLVNEITGVDDEKRLAYRYYDGKNVVNFVCYAKSNIVHVHQPGVCLFEKCFATNNAKTKWEQI